MNSPTYEKNDYSKINEHFDHISKEKAYYTYDKYSNLWLKITKIFLLVGIFFLLFYLIYNIVSWLNSDRSKLPTQITDNSVTNNRYVNEHNTNDLALKKINELNKDTTKDNAITDYAIFRTQTPTNGDFVVTTGIGYVSSNDNKPNHQWCYLEGLKNINSVSLRITLANMDSDGNVIYGDVSKDTADTMNLQLEQILSARKLCSFI